MVSQQLTLRFAWGDFFSFANFYPASNKTAVLSLQQAAQGKGEQLIYLWGTRGTGKSHLLQAACQEAADCGMPVAYLPLQELKSSGPGIFQGLEQLSLLCIDDVQLIAGQPDWEHALFDLFNRVQESGGVLVFAADCSPSALDTRLGDLRSRLGWGPVFRLEVLTETDKIAALRLRAQGRGFDLPEEVALYLMRHSPRDTVSLFELLDRLDEQSLVQQRKLTIPFVRKLL